MWRCCDEIQLTRSGITPDRRHCPIEHRTHSFTLDRCLSDVDPRVFVLRSEIHILVYMYFKFGWYESCHKTVGSDDVIKWKHFPRYWPFVQGIIPVTGEFPSQGPVTRRFNVFLDLRLKKRLSKPSRCWWFKTPSRSILRHCNEVRFAHILQGYFTCIIALIRLPQPWRMRVDK